MPILSPRLEWQDESDRPGRFTLTGGEVLMGRRSDADIVLTQRQVSRLHARIVREGDAFYLVDLESSHGTFVNGERIERRQLQARDRIRLGAEGVEMVFVTQAEALPGADATQLFFKDATGRVTSGSESVSSGHTIWEGAGLERSVRRLASVLPDETESHTELEKISCLLDFHYYFGKAFSADRTFNHILKSALQISGAERGFILKKQGSGFEYAVGQDGAGTPLGQADFRMSGSVVEKVSSGGQPVFMTQGIHGDLAASESIVAMKLRAVACMPLEAMSQDSDAPAVMGILYLDSRKHMHALSGLDEKLLRRLAGEAGHVLEKLEMVVALNERKRIEQELAIAEETQQSLLPRSLPKFEPFQIRTFCRATRQLGGDFYDFITLEAGLTGILADVSGKGIPAALLSSLTLGALNMEFRSSANPAKVLGGVNKLLCEKTPVNRFVTLFLYQLNAAGKGVYISAGHNTAYVYRAATGTIEELPSGGIPLGMFPFAAYKPESLELEARDILVVYSDGLTEAENVGGEEFGEERLLGLIRTNGAKGVGALETSLLAELDQFTQGASQTDDITFMLLQNG